MKKALSIKRLVLLFSLLNICFDAYSQTINYSRQTGKLPDHDKVQFVANVAGYHHVLFLKKNEAIAACIFDRELQFTGKKELPVKWSDSFDVRLIPFKDVYYLYLRTKGKTRQELWKITAQGDATSLTSAFQQFIDTAFKQNTTIVQLVNKNEQLAVIANTYYEEQKVLATTVTRVDENFKTLSSRTFSYPFERGANLLSQLMLIGENLFILKPTRHTQNYSLDLIKAEAATGKMFRKTFNSTDNFTPGATFRFIAADSSILVQSSLGAKIFISKLNLSLKEMIPPTLIESGFSNKVPVHFLFLGGEVQQWLAMSLPAARLRPQSNTIYAVPPENFKWRVGYDNEGRAMGSLYDDVSAYRNTVRGFGTFTRPYYYDLGFSNFLTRYRDRFAAVEDKKDPLPVRFSAIDKNFTPAGDSIFENKKNSAILNASQFADFIVNGKHCLILRQDLPHSKKGLMLVYVNDKNQIIASDVTVFENFDYLLQNTQTIGKDTLLIPYVQKSEVGLVKLRFENLEK